MRSPATTNISGKKTNRKNNIFSTKKEATEYDCMDKRFARRDYDDKKKNTGFWHESDKNMSSDHPNGSEKFDSNKKAFVTPVILSRARKKEESSQSEINVESKQESRHVEAADARKQIQIASKAKEAFSLPEHKMKTSFKILDESLDMSNEFNPFLLDQSQFFIVSVVGSQGSGKSTIASFLADPSSVTKISIPLIFRPESKEEIFRGTHCTVGIDAYITKERVIILDFQPILASSVMDSVVNQDRKNGSDFSSTVNMMEVESIQMLTLAMSISHVLLVVQDIHTQMSISHFLSTCSMMTPPYGNSSGRESNRGGYNNMPQFLPHLVFIHNRMTPHHFNPTYINDMQAAYFNSLIDSGFFMFSQVGISSGTIMPALNPETCPHQVNTFLIPDFECEKNCPVSFLDSIAEMRRQVLSLSRQQTTSAAPTEKSWYQFTCRTWDAIRKSKLFAEYNHTLP